MTASARPFGARDYTLARCALVLLEEAAEARKLAEMLAGLEPWRTLGYTADGLAQYLQRHDPALRRYRVVAGVATIGVVCIRFPWLRGPYIELIGFAPAGQRQGLGGDVIAWVEEEVRHEAANVWALVSSYNGAARRFYARQGFVEIASLDGLVAPRHAEILVRKRL